MRSVGKSTLVVVALAAIFAGTARADDGPRTEAKPKTARPKVVIVDRVIARWTSTEHGLSAQPHVVFGRQLAFEARLEAMASGEAPDAPLTERHVRAALNRHIAENLLALLPIDPMPTPEVIAARATAAATVLDARVGGADKVAAAAAKEGISSDEVAALLRRSARASLYLDRMVAPQLEPTRAELLELHGSGTTPYSKEPFDKVENDLRRWALAQRLNDALDSFYQRTRSRVVVTWAKDASTAADRPTAIGAIKVPKRDAPKPR